MLICTKIGFIRFIRFQTVVFRRGSRRTNGRTNRWKNGQVENTMSLPASLAWRTH